MIHDKSFAGSRALFMLFFPRLSTRKTTAEPLRSQRLRCARGKRSHGALWESLRTASRSAGSGSGQRAVGSAPPGPPDPPGSALGWGGPRNGGWGGGGGAAPCAARSVPAVGAAMGFIPFQLVIDSLEHHRGYFIESIQSRLFIRSRYYSKGTISWKKKNLPNLEEKKKNPHILNNFCNFCYLWRFWQENK